MEKTTGILIDTNVLVSKKVEIVEGFWDQLYVTPIVLLEYLNWATESRNTWLSRGDKSRAQGYMRLIKLLPQVLEALGVKILAVEYNISDLVEAVMLVEKRSVDPGDALNAIATRKYKLRVLTMDRDWLRLKDYTVDVILV